MVLPSCTGSIPIACFIGCFFGSLNGPENSFGEPTRNEPVKVEAKSVKPGLSVCCRASTQTFCGSLRYFSLSVLPSTMWWHEVQEMPSRASAPYLASAFTGSLEFCDHGI